MDEQALDPLDAYSAVVTRVVREVAPSVASLTVLGERGPLGSGSGVVIDVGILVTNAHVAGRGRRVVASFSDGSMADAAVAGVDRLSDLAVLRTGDALPAPAVLGDAADTGRRERHPYGDLRPVQQSGTDHGLVHHR